MGLGMCSIPACLNATWQNCEVCGAALCGKHLHSLSRPFHNRMLSTEATVNLGKYIQRLPPGASGYINILVCEKCHKMVSGMAPWVWEETTGPRYGRSPLEDLAKYSWRPEEAANLKDGVIDALKALDELKKIETPLWNAIPKTPAKARIIGYGTPIDPTPENMRAAKHYKKPKPEEKPEEIDPQMQRLLDLLDREVL